MRIRTDSGESAKVNMLVTRKDILGLYLLLRYDATKVLGGVLIMSWNGAIPGDPSMCRTSHQSA